MLFPAMRGMERIHRDSGGGVLRPERPTTDQNVNGVQLCCATMIHPYDNETQNRWNRGEFKVQLSMKGNGRPLGYCEGTDEDIAALQAIAEAEGAEQVRIHKQVLKSGREIWTVG